MWPWGSKEDKQRRAVREGDAAAVRKLLAKRSLDVDARDERGRTPLYLASLHGHAEVVELLLKANAPVDVPDKDGRTPLHLASSNGDAEVVELLLKANAAVDAARTDGWTPLRIASADGHSEVIKSLLKANAVIDAADKDGRTPLYYASMNGHIKAVELLLKANAPVDAARTDGRTSLHLASLMGHAQVVELLLKANATVNAVDQENSTPLHEACERHHSHVVRVLLKSGAHLDAKDKNCLMPFHRLIRREYGCVSSSTVDTLQVLVTSGAKWDAACDEIVSAGKAWDEAPALALCIQVWAQELADGLSLTEVPIEVVIRGTGSTQEYIDSLKSSRDILVRRKICLVGPSCAGKTSFAKSITTNEPQLEHHDDRTIGINHIPLRFEQYVASRDNTKKHEVTFWDFAGQDAYQASIMATVKKQETQLMDEFIERTVMKWIRLIVARQPEADFFFIPMKEDLLKANVVTERLLKHTLVAKLKDVESTTQEMRHKMKTHKPFASGVTVSVHEPKTLFVSCTTAESVQAARSMVIDLITKSDRGFYMPESYTQALQAIVQVRTDAKSQDITTRIELVFAKVDTLRAKLKLGSELNKIILQTLHDLGDVLWYEDLGVKLFQDRVILDPLLLIDFIRQVINHNYTGQIMPHSDLKALPYWEGLRDKEQMKAMKQVLQKFYLVYSADQNRTMAWDSDLIVPAYWQTKTPASWLWLGDILRLNPTKIGLGRNRLSVSDMLGITSTETQDGEAVRVHWEFHFEFGLPSSLFDQFVVASVSPFFTFDAGPDWIVYEEEDATACRLMVGRDPTSLHRTIHAEALVADAASPSQADELWESFEQLVGAFMSVLREYPGLDVSSFAWDNAHKKIGLKRLAQSRTVPSKCAKWMPPAKHWTSIQKIIRQRVSSEE